ncbi:cyclic nucleotide-binding domain-containing protein [Microseira wollei]|nr:cyclic nucleotide-binding domain-containing protein [Microseira wollei]
MQYLELVHLSEGEFLFRQGDPSEGLYFIESGQISVVVALSDGETKRLRTYTTGAIVGEMGLYGNAPRFASVVSVSNSRLYHLSNQAFARIETEEPLLTQVASYKLWRCKLASLLIANLGFLAISPLASIASIASIYDITSNLSY